MGMYGGVITGSATGETNPIRESKGLWCVIMLIKKKTDVGIAQSEQAIKR